MRAAIDAVLESARCAAGDPQLRAQHRGSRPAGRQHRLLARLYLPGAPGAAGNLRSWPSGCARCAIATASSLRCWTCRQTAPGSAGRRGEAAARVLSAPAAARDPEGAGRGRRRGRRAGRPARQARAAELPEAARKEADRELSRLERINAQSPEYQMVRTYLEWLAELPWNKPTGRRDRYRHARRGARRGPLRPGKDQGAHPRISGGQAAPRQYTPIPTSARASRSWRLSARRASARPAWARASLARWAAPSCA